VRFPLSGGKQQYIVGFNLTIDTGDVLLRAHLFSIYLIRSFNMKRLLAILLGVLLLCSTVLVSCNDADDVSKSPDESDVSEGVTGYDPESGKYVANLPEFKWDIKDSRYKTFDVAVTSNEQQPTFFSEDLCFDKYSTTDAVINEAVRERNNKIEQMTGVVINPIFVKDVTLAVQEDIASGGGKYDMAMPFLRSVRGLAQEGHLYALNSEELSPYLDLSMPWWSQGANDAFSVANRIYFTTGDITIMSKMITRALVFNKEMYAQLFAGEKSLYEMVEEGTWTYDKLITMCKAATFNDGDDVWDYRDRWGLVSELTDPYQYYSASGELLVQKDSDDLPYLTFETDRSIEIAQRLLEEYSKKNTWHICSNTLNTPDIWVTSLDIFGEGRALFRTSVFSAIKKLRNYDTGIEFGIIPLPKFDEEQESYYAPSGDMVYVVVIPVTAPDPEFSAYMTQLVACEAKNYLTPAYYETTLKSRDARDDESEKMLDEYIFANLRFDVGAVYDFGGISSMFFTLAQQGSADVVSKFESIKDKAEADIQDTIDSYTS